MSKTTITQFIIERLCDADEVSRTLFPRKHRHSYFMQMLLESDPRRKIRPATISSILSRLKRQGLVERVGSKQNTLWHVTPKGKEWRKAHDQHLNIGQPRTDGITRLVIFDIPEYDRKKRTAVRTELFGCNFRQLQKSVWIGTCPLPESFIMLLDELDLKGKVYIFSVRERGTIDKV